MFCAVGLIFGRGLTPPAPLGGRAEQGGSVDGKSGREKNKPGELAPASVGLFFFPPAFPVQWRTSGNIRISNIQANLPSDRCLFCASVKPLIVGFLRLTNAGSLNIRYAVYSLMSDFLGSDRRERTWGGARVGGGEAPPPAGGM